jgi:hypothetical protein
VEDGLAMGLSAKTRDRLPFHRAVAHVVAIGIVTDAPFDAQRPAVHRPVLETVLRQDWVRPNLAPKLLPSDSNRG